MTHRYDSLDEALGAIDTGAAVGNYRVVVSWTWWDALPEAEQDAYRARCEALRVRLIADHRISRHYVEVTTSDEPPLSSEYRA